MDGAAYVYFRCGNLRASMTPAWAGWRITDCEVCESRGAWDGQQSCREDKLLGQISLHDNVSRREQCVRSIRHGRWQGAFLRVIRQNILKYVCMPKYAHNLPAEAGIGLASGLFPGRSIRVL